MIVWIPQQLVEACILLELSTDTEEMIELKAMVTQLQEQLSAKDKSIEVSILSVIHTLLYLLYNTYMTRVTSYIIFLGT